MKLGIVGNLLEIIEIIYSEISQTDYIAKLLVEAENYLDVVIFLGESPFKLINKKIIPTKPWDFIRKDYSSFLIAVNKAVIKHNYNIYNASFDSYKKDTILYLYNKIGIDIYIYIIQTYLLQKIE